MTFIDELKRRNVIRVALAYTIVAWLIAQVTELAFESFGTPDWAIKTVLFLLIIGFPLALLFAWAYELTSDGLKREKDIDRSASITRQTGRKLNYTIIAVLVLSLAYFAVDKFVFDLSGDGQVSGTTPAKSIAVLPFVNMSSDPEQEYFSDGISEELLNVLSQIPGLQVSARTSSFQFKGDDLDIIDIGRKLNAGLVLEGSVRKAGPRVRITAQLIDASNGFHLWSETYDRELQDIFAVQDELSAAIVSALQAHIGLQVEAAPRVRAADSPEAHEAYLRGRYLMVQSTRAGREKAIHEFESALSYDPDYALAHAGITMALLTGLDSGEVRARAAHHADRSMALDPTLAEAHAATGLLLWNQSKFEDALRSFKRAIQINPNYVIVYLWSGNLLNYDLGRYNEAFQMRATAMRLDPLSIPTIVYYLQALLERNRLTEADRELEKIASIFPHVYAYRRGSRMSLGGNIANAVLGSLESLRINPEYSRVKTGLAYHLAVIGLGNEVHALFDFPRSVAVSWLGNREDAVVAAEARLADDPDSLGARHYLGLALAGAGDYARARPILEEMWRQSGGRISKRSDVFGTATAAALIAIRRDAGEEANVGELIASIRDNVRRYREAGIVGDGRSYGVDFDEGLAAYLSGDRETGLALLAKGTEDGVFILPNEAYLQALYDDPGFAPILARQEARQGRERDKVLAIVCGENPYEAVWQPAEGTCEQFAASTVN